MAPMKRVADSAPSDESDTDLDHSDLGSDSSQSSRKRRRIDGRPAIHEDSDSGNDNSASTPPFDLDDEDAYEIIATQDIRRKHANRKQNDNIPAESGILEEVEVHNFMCHKHFSFTLGPLINFICGKNGSGKSAILTAITLCLGAKASSTNRGGSLKNFVKQGESHAIIAVKVKNQGDGSYLPEVFGNSIVVERHFNTSGASGFKIKNESGKIISTKKAMLEEICDHFALQIDNPMNVLSQDQARAFISATSAADKYRQFVKGVQLEQLDQDYRLIEDGLDQMEAKLEERRPDVKMLEQHMLKAKNKLAMSDKHESLRERISHYRRQLAWVQVQQQEQIRDDYIKEIAEAGEKIAQVEEEVVKHNTVYEDADRSSTEATQSFQAAEEEVKKLQEEKAEEKIKHDEVKKETSDAQADQRAIRDALKVASAMINSKKQEIEEEQQRLAELNGGGAAARLASLEEAKHDVVQARQERQIHEDSKEQWIQNVDLTKHQLDQHQENVSLKAEEVKRHQVNIDNFARNRGAQDLVFHKDMPLLLRAIQQEKRFAQKPIGPIGKHVQLIKPEWSSILEKSFGSTLNSFIVTSKTDMNLLNAIMTRVRCICPIIIGNSLPLDTAPNEPDLEFETALRVLKIDNELVRKQLVIQHGIEQTILIADLDKASDILYSVQRPRNVKRCYCVDSNNKRRGYMLSYTRNGEASQDPVAEYVGRSRMNTDIEAQLRLSREALEDTKDQLRRLEQDFRAARDRHEKAKQAQVRHDRQDRELKIAVEKAEDRVEELEQAIADDNVESGKLEVLRKALAAAEASKALHEGSFENSVIALDAKKAQLTTARGRLAAIDERIVESQAISQRASAEAQKLSKKRAVALGEKNAAIGRIEDAKEDRRSLERNRDTMIEKVVEFAAQAEHISGRVNIDEGETEKSLKKKYDKLKADHAKYQQQIGGTREQIAADAAKTSEAYEAGKKDLQDLERMSGKLKLSLIERRERWKIFRSFISCRAKAQFTYLLSERSFRGKLITDHTQKLLELSVEPDITKHDGEGRGARTLSGGEKSFSQICLLLSIWEAMGSPIRCLDEFDVYMDAVNRSMSVSMLIEAARQSVGRQFILISPGTRSDIKKADDINVQEMPEAERGQTRLPFTAA